MLLSSGSKVDVVIYLLFMILYLQFLVVEYIVMKKQGHPEYHQVLFVDTSTGFKFVCGSTIKSDKMEEVEGKKLPVITLSISSSSHPFFVGGKQFIDTEGRVEKFKKRYIEKKQVVAAPAVEVEAEAAQTPAKKTTKAKAPKK